MYISEFTIQNTKTLNISDRAMDCDVLDFRIIQIRFSTMFVFHIQYVCTMASFSLFPLRLMNFTQFFNPCYALYLLSLLKFFSRLIQWMTFIFSIIIIIIMFVFQRGREKIHLNLQLSHLCQKAIIEFRRKE